MEKIYDEDLFIKMHEIHKLILQRIVDTGEIFESDMLFIQLYRDKFLLINNSKEAKGEKL